MHFLSAISISVGCLFFAGCECAPTLPVIDLSQSEAAIVEQLSAAASDYGFFYVTHHGIQRQFQEMLIDQSHQLFHLSDDTKKNYLRNASHFGYTAFKSMSHDSSTILKEGDRDTHESFYFGDERHSEFGTDTGFVNYNQWPPSVMLKNIVNIYIAQITELALRLNEYLALSLHLPKGFFNQKSICGDSPMSVLRLLHYLPDVSDVPSGKLGIGSHSDWGLLTFLLTDGSPGLQVKHGEEWIPVAHIENALVVNIGDILQRWTGDAYVSAKHRVVSSTGRDRYSAAFFWEPNSRCVVRGLPGIGRVKYPPITHGDYLTSKFLATQKRAPKANGDESQEKGKAKDVKKVKVIESKL